MPHRLFLSFLVFLAAVTGQEIVPGRFIVELEGSPAIGHAAPQRRRMEIGEQHSRMARVLQSRRARVTARVDTVANALIVTAPDASALTLLPGVLRVVPVRALRPLLYQALVNHAVAAAWDLSGGVEQAGAGQKIAILDTGIDTTHPGFQAPEGFPVPEGYPLASSDGNLALTNAKVIVARSFDSGTARDLDGHGTAVAMCAAGVRHETPRGVISGVAPAAWLGAYRVSDLSDGLFYTDVILQAFDWAVKDGMNVINLSFGSVGAFGPDGDPVFEGGVRRAIENGILVVNAAGNTAGPSTVDDTASAEGVIAAGSNNSTSATQAAVVPSTGPPMPAAASSNVVSHDPVMGPMVDAAALDNSRGCKPFEEGSLAGKIPLIERGGCFFYEKLANAAAGGAEAAVVYNAEFPSSGTPDDLVTMTVDDGPSIPGLFVGRTDGLRLKDFIASDEQFQVVLRFPSKAGFPNQISSFSSRGPSIDLRIKPDLLATGSSVYTAAIQAPAASCGICDPSGYRSVSGTSFSAPITSGAAAVLRAARPGLSVDQYRSLLINSAAPFHLADGTIAPVMSAGAGILNLKNAVSSTLAAAPVSVSFASGGGTFKMTRPIRLKNLSAEPAGYLLSVESSNEAKPALPVETLTLDPGAEQTLDLTFNAADLAPGPYEGFVKVTNTATSAETRIPYWYAVQGSGAGAIALLRVDPSQPRAGENVRIYFRVHDQAGLVLTQPAPVVVPISGGGAVVSLSPALRSYPNSWILTYRPGPVPGPNVFTIQVGGESFTYQLTTGN
jgi:hypothetical protein